MAWFLNWYYKHSLYQLNNLFVSVLLAVWDFFSLPLLVKTLGEPWKRDLVRARRPGLSELTSALAMNFASRFFGFLIRLTAIVAGVISLLATAVLGAIIWLELILAPISLPVLLIGAVSLLLPPVIWWGAVLLANFLLVGILELKLVTINYHFPPAGASLSALFALDKANAQSLTAEQFLPYLEPRARRITKKGASGLVAWLAREPKVRFILDRALVSPAEFAKLKINTSLKDILKGALCFALKLEHRLIETADILLALTQTNPNAQKIFSNRRISAKDLLSLANWQHHMWQLRYPPGFLLEPRLRRHTGGLGASWSYGYTPVLQKFGKDITQAIGRDYHLHYLAHKQNVREIKRVLTRSGRHNCLLVGEPGVGKRTSVEMLAWDISYAPDSRSLVGKRLVELDVGRIIAMGEGGGLARTLVRIFDEALASGNIILFVNNIERLFGNASLGSINALELLTPYLNSDRLRLIGTVTPSQLHAILDQQPVLGEMFEQILINEPSLSAVLQILEEATPFIENRHGLMVSYLAVKEALALSQRYFLNHSFPQKTLDLLDEVCAQFSSEQKTKIILPEHIQKIVSAKARTPVGDPTRTEAHQLLDLDKRIHERLVNQTKAVREITGALKRARAGTRGGEKPVGTFLFLGPTGVGKTQTAKTLANIYYGGEERMIRLDMSEYQTPATIAHLLGGAGRGGYLTNAIADQPFSLLLLDEIEKSHPRVLDIFLQILDEGRVKDALGKVVSFRESIIIATSNAGANFLRKKINLEQKSGEKIDMNKISRELLEYVQNQGIFRPEFLNRFDAIVPFRTLRVEELKKVAEILLGQLNRQLAPKQIKIALTPKALEKIARLGFNPEYGARALERVMREKIENLVAEHILANPGDRSVLTISEKML